MSLSFKTVCDQKTGNGRSTGWASSGPEAWTFATSLYSLRSPFTQYVDFPQTTVLASMTNTPLGTVRTFSYSGGTQGGGELLEATMPDGGNL